MNSNKDKNKNAYDHNASDLANAMRIDSTRARELENQLSEILAEIQKCKEPCDSKVIEVIENKPWGPREKLWVIYTFARFVEHYYNIPKGVVIIDKNSLPPGSIVPFKQLKNT